MSTWQPTRRQVLYGAAALAACGPASRLGGDAGVADAGTSDAELPDAAVATPDPSPDDVSRGARNRGRSDGNVQRTEEGGVVSWVAAGGNRSLRWSRAGITLESAYGDGGDFASGLGPALEHDVRRMFGETVLAELRVLVVG